MTTAQNSIAVIFEVEPKSEHMQNYLDIAAELRDYLKDIDGFISIERFQSLADPKKLLSLSFWENEESVRCWREMLDHREAQHKGHTDYFSRYRIRVANVCRDYTMEERSQAPEDSNTYLCENSPK